MTNTVGAFEAKTRLSDLLQRVEAGERITITKHGRPVANLLPISEPPTSRDWKTFWEWVDSRGLKTGRANSIKADVDAGRL